MKCFAGLLAGVLFAATLCAGDAAPKPDKRAPQRVKSIAQLTKLLNKRPPRDNYKVGPTLPQTPGGPVNELAGAPAGDAGAGGGDAGTNYSGTNVQVAGVDEADIVKTDGEYTCQISQSKVHVIRAAPAADLGIVSTLSFDSNFYPYELFIGTNRLVVIGTGYEVRAIDEDLYFPSRTYCSVLVYDTTNKAAPVELRKIKLDGGYLSSRRIGDNVYIVARNYPMFFDFIGIATGGGAAVEARADKSKKKRKRRVRKEAALYVPEVSDTASGGGELKPVLLDDVWYLPDFGEPDYLMVAAFNMQDGTTPVKVTALLGAGEQVYASRENLYVAASVFVPPNADKEEYSFTTQLYRFTLKDTVVTFTNRGQVPGTILNQFSMDEYDGHFRVATTDNQWSAAPSNGVYVLNSEMAVVGALENIAPTERIFSARFITDRCYLVTFRQIDPLFVIGLSNPAAPKILGELKLPGVSDYLHPYDDGHLIGIGRDVDADGRFRGLKLSLFDVTNVTEPREKFSTTVPGSFAYSEAQYDHRALLFDKAKNLLALPVAVYEPEPTKTVTGSSANAFVGPWQGAYVYSLSTNNGFELRQRITHQVGANDYFAGIRRLLYIGDNLYTHSEKRVKIHNLATLAEIKSLDLPFTDYDFGILTGEGTVGGTTTGASTDF